MFTNFLKITLRNLYREKLYTIINIAGLSIGIACCLILGLFLHSGLTYDQHNKNYKRIYRIAMEIMNPQFATTQPVLASLLKKVNPDIIEYVRFGKAVPPKDPGIAYRSGDNTVLWQNVYAVDDNVFEVFTYDIIFGDPKTALVDPNSIAVSETFARTYFGDENPIGKTVSTDSGTYKISLVFADLPANTHVKTDVLMPFRGPVDQVNESNLENQLFNNIYCYTYLVLPEDYPQDSVKKMNEAFYQKYFKGNVDLENVKMHFWLQPLKDIHYKSSGLLGDQANGNILYLYGSLAIGLLVLLVACINYMNLATARSLKRGREVGIYRVMGANRSQLILHFMGESILITLMALCLAMFIAELVLVFTPIKEMTGNLHLTDYVTKPMLLCWLIGSTIFTGVVSGAYPAFYLSSISPMAAITALKKAATAQFKMRQILVLIQFIISIGVIACTFLMISQMRYIANKPLGFEKENRVVIRLRGADVIEKHKVIKIELLKNPNVLGVTVCRRVPGDYSIANSRLPVENNDGIMEPINFVSLAAYNDDYLHVMGLKLLEGRDFSKEISTDVNAAVIVNETFVREMGWDNPLDKKFGLSMRERRVIGVVKDFHYESMYSPVAPYMLAREAYDASRIPLQKRNGDSRTMIASISGKDIPQTIGHIRNVMGKIDPKHAFEYEFLDDIIDRLYVTENQMMVLTGLFACISVFISCLGLFGLSAFTAEQRTMEIGVRKALGASSMQIVFMLSRPTLILVLTASVIASISAYLVMDEWWLTDFAYRTEINPLVFILATALAIIIAFITVALQSLKAAQANPVEALRYE